ncbi:MAG: glutathione S-transferase family protein [Marinosulfonomonas sp.]|nr:glutathione S-transferase family protein [Marinosulfonomonas sp.]
MITVYGRATSSNVQAVMWGIAELGLEHERLDYGHVYGGLDSPEFTAISPHALVPAIRDGDVGLFESSAILRYLGARYGDAPFWPKDVVARAHVDIWAEWAKLNFCREFTQLIFLPLVRTAAKDRDPARLLLDIETFECCVDRLEEQLEKHDYLASGDFTLADIVIGSVLFRWFDLDIERRPRPLVQAYYNRLKDRPAYREHVMISYESLRAEGA